MQTKQVLTLLAAALCLAVAGCKDKTPPDDPYAVHVESVAIEGAISPLALEIGETRQLTAIVLPENADNRTVSCRSSNPAVASVADGLITALGEGVTIVTATTADGGKTADINVTVSAAAPYINVLDYIPDPVFRAYCVAHLSDLDDSRDGRIQDEERGWDTDGNGELSRAEAAAVTHINVDGYNSAAWKPAVGAKIASLEGLEYFRGLKYLECWMNEITTIDVSQNTALEYFRCNGNRLTAINVSQNAALKTLWCYENPLTGLDVTNNPALSSLFCFGIEELSSINVSNNPELRQLQCQNTGIRSIDVSNNAKLEQLHCFQLQLTELDVTHNPALWQLYCQENNLTKLDVEKNTALADLYCYQNQLTELNVTNNVAMKQLYCHQNQITALDLTKCALLDMFSCDNNKITTLNVTNNTAMRRLFASNNLLSTLDISKNNKIEQFSVTGNPGDGASKFPVKAWFDNTAVPTGFTKGDWTYSGKKITIDYQKQ